MPPVIAGREVKPPRSSRRKRILDRLCRISSAPQLSLHTSRLLPEREYRKRNCVSCSSLPSSSTALPTPAMALRAVESMDMLGAPSESWDYSSILLPPTEKKALQDTWAPLPGEIKFLILGYLEPKELVRCSSVCKAWHDICFDGQLWETLDATGFYDMIPVSQLERMITTSGSFMKNLNLRGCVQLRGPWKVEAGETETKHIWHQAVNLLTVTLEGCKLDALDIRFIIIQNSHLVQINLSGLSGVSNDICKAIAQSLPLLESLDVSWCKRMDSRGIKEIVDGCKRLRELKAREIKKFDEVAPMQAIFKANRLEKLWLGGCDAITDESIRVLMEGIEPDIDPLTDRCLAPPRKLVHLDLSRCSRITDVALTSMAEHVPELEGLDLGGCESLTDAGLGVLLPTMPKLTHLDLEECSLLTNRTLWNIASGPAAKRLQHLQCTFCEHMGNAGMVEIIRKCTALRNLEMDNTRISDLILSEAAHAVSHRPIIGPDNNFRVSLRLVVFDCANITWTGVREILARNAEIRPRPNVIQLKCYNGWQKMVDEHTKRVLRGDLLSANRLEGKWAEHMVLAEEGGNGNRRRRLRQREAALWGLGDEGGRRSRRMRSCVVM